MREDKVFVDSNIIIYAFDISAGNKHETARDVVSGLWKSGSGVLSTQVLQEFFVSVTRKIPNILDPSLAKVIVRDFLKWKVIVNDGECILDAIDLHMQRGYSFWDSMIIAAAIKGGCTSLLSEDLSAGQSIGGVAIRNPFCER